MQDSTKILNVLNMCRMELHREKLKKMDKTINYDKIQLLETYKEKYEGLISPTFIPPYGAFDGGLLTQDGYQTITEDGLFDIQWEIQLFFHRVTPPRLCLWDQSAMRQAHPHPREYATE